MRNAYWQAVGAGMAVLVVSLHPNAVLAQAIQTVPNESLVPYNRGQEQAHRWSGNASMGFLGNTPDGMALAMNGGADYFVTNQVSVGPLVQLGLTNDLTQVGLSGQGKYWIDLPGTNGRAKLNFQSGIGFVHADFRNNDTSWLVPIGIGYDYTLPSGPSLSATVLVNFTDLNTGAGTGADVMPGFIVGLRF